jgi:rhombotail lipoprotein
VQRRSSALEFLYPQGKPAEPGRDVVLRVPLRIGLIFTPPAANDFGQFGAQQQRVLLERVSRAFAGNASVRHVEVLPSHYLMRRDGFDGVERLAATLNLDVVGMVSYDQFQFSDTDRWRSLAYWTIVGIHAVRGEKNQTRTLMDVVVYDVASRTLLFRSAGESVLQAYAAPIGAGEVKRKQSEIGFERAADSLIANIKTSFDEFAKQAASGTVRGPGTPGIQIARQ